jgi:imidazolonepropionase-like amidohydrolase
MAEKRIYLVPTDWNEQFRYEAFLQPRNLSPEELRQLQGEAKARAASRRERLRRAIKMGVPIAAGSDIYYKVKGRTRGEVSKMIFVGYAEAGMTPLAIIRAATLNAAELIGWQNQIGSLEPNKLADIIAVEGDPLKDVSEINRVRFVMKGGLVITNQTGLQSPQRQVNEH